MQDVPYADLSARLLADGQILDKAAGPRPVRRDPKELPGITVDDAEVDWRQPAVRVDRQVRACTPAPGAWTTFRGERLKLGPVVPLPDEAPLAPGALAVEFLKPYGAP